MLVDMEESDEWSLGFSFSINIYWPFIMFLQLLEHL